MTDYNAKSISVLTGLDPIKHRPGMYTDTSNPNHLISEVLDNSIDEVLAGYASEINITYNTDKSITIKDNGRGIPVDFHKEEGAPAAEVIFTKLHSSGKFNNQTYAISGGLHGVGVCVVTALSKFVKVNIVKGEQEHYLDFADATISTKLTLIEKNSTKTKGTTVTFLPDGKYFDDPSFNINTLKKTLKTKSILCPGLKISFEDANTGDSKEWLYIEGLQGYIALSCKEEMTLPNTPVTATSSKDNESVSWAVAWTPDSPVKISESYANVIPTPLGGTHLGGFKQGILEASKDFCEFKNLLPRGVKLTQDDVMHSANYIISVEILDPRFAGQTKEKLTTSETSKLVSSLVKEEFAKWLNANKDEALALVEHFIDRANSRLRKAKRVTRKKITQGPTLPGKLTDCSSEDLNISELFLVEGDSAGGSAKQAREREFQAIMPLRGKILNTWEVESSVVLGSTEIHDISVALGVDPSSEDISGLRYGKVCILADADSDGLHIATLLCGLFLKHFEPLVRNGHIYVAMPPLYRIDINKEVFYALDEEEKEAILKKLSRKKGKVSVQRFKGLGEMNPQQLRETTMLPDSRRLVQLEITDAKYTNDVIDMLLNKHRANDRKTWLTSRGDEATVA